MTTLKPLVERTDELLGEDDVYYLWNGYAHSDAERLRLLTRTFLNVLFRLEDGTAVFRRIVGYSDRKNGVPSVVYTTEVAFRITSGHRSGWVVPRGCVGVNERFVAAGVSKRLVCGEAGDCFSETRRGDCTIVGLFEQLLEAPPEHATTPVYPEIYLTCPPDNRKLSCRSCGTGLAYLSALIPYDTTKTFRTNWLKHKDDIAVGVGMNGRIGYPFGIVHGRGVLAASPYVFDVWRRSSRILFNETKPHVRLVLRNESADLDGFSRDLD